MADKSICQVHGCVNDASGELGLCAAHIQFIKGGRADIRIGVGVCVVDGCGKRPHSTYHPYCAAHVARLRRKGTLDQVGLPQFLQHSHGYKLILAKGHPMARGIRAYEHRVVFYDNNPDGPGRCYWCGQELEWSTVQVDHLNCIRDDNRIDNLVASCGGCNRDRAKPSAAKAARKRAKGYMVNGKWLSIVDAARSIGIAPGSITQRLDNGWSIERALTEKRGRFGPKKTA